MNSNFKSIKYKWIYNSVDKNLIEETAYKHNMPKPVAELMLKKGISSPDDIEAAVYCNNKVCFPCSYFFYSFLIKPIAFF